MAVNADKPLRWKGDVRRSVDLYNSWFLDFAPQTFRETRARTTGRVEADLRRTDNLHALSPALLRDNPGILQVLRMVTAPPLARDRLIGLADVTPSLVGTMEARGVLPPRMAPEMLEQQLGRIVEVVLKLADRDILSWLDSATEPGDAEIHRAATVVADRLTGAMADPLIRNAQEQRQLALLKIWLEARGYTHILPGTKLKLDVMTPGTFSFRLNVSVTQEGGVKAVNIPVDAVIKPLNATPTELPLLVEAKSAGDYTNVNKRRKEEATKVKQLRHTYGPDVRFILFLCGYFDSGYLGYEAAEGIDWVWEHRVDDLAEFGL
jgi:hypothetical protein